MAALVLHILPVDAFRGAQAYARDLRVRLDGPVRHRTVTLFASDEGGALQPDIALGVPSGPLRTRGLDPRAVRALRRLVRTERPDVVVAHGGEPLKYAAIAGIPTERLVYLKIGGGDELLRGPRRALHRFAVGRAVTVVAVSASAAEEARALGVDEARLHIIPNGRDVTKYRVAARAPSATTRLLYVGRLNASKRPERFVAVARRLRDEGCAVDAVIAGEGPLAASLRTDAGDAAQLLGTIDDVPSLLATADVFVFTGQPPEGMPGVLIEAGLAALPVVTTDVPGARDVVADGETGFVVPVDDFVELLDATRRLVSDAALRRAFGTAARARCVERFDIDTGVARWDQLLTSVMDAPCTSAT